MKRSLTFLLLALLLFACSKPPEQPVDLSVTVVTSDLVPSFIFQMAGEYIQIGDEVHEQALVISNDILQQTNANDVIKNWLRDTLTKVPVAIYHGTTADAVRLLDIDAPISISQKGEYVFAVVYDPPGETVYVTSILIPKDSPQGDNEQVWLPGELSKALRKLQ